MRIGVFDSGLGGLTVAREIKKRYPGHSIIYAGDTARVPWGTRSPRVIKQFSRQLLRFLETKKVSFIVVACHTASSVAIPYLKKNTKLSVYGVIEPAADAVARVARGRVGILGTPATIKSRAWEKAIKRQNNGVKVYSESAPLLVPLVEEGWEKHEIARKIIKEYTKILLEKEIDTLVLACTHYPLLASTFRAVLGKGVKLINPGVEIAKSLEIRDRDGDTRDEFYFTDLSDRVKARLSHFYGREINGSVKEVNIENL